MVQYIHTPWRDRAELLAVRGQLYSLPPHTTTTPTSSSHTARVLSNGNDDGTEIEQRRHAVSRVAMWVQRGSCPHMVESTGLLMAAILDDLHEAKKGRSTSAVRLAYSAAFSRFVTGLLDSHQDKQMKQSMYSIAKTIGLPATFVELRHQCTHEQLPSLLKLRSAAQKSLIWIWDYYWKHLIADEPVGDAAEAAYGHTCTEMLTNYLLTEDTATRKVLEKRLKQWDEATLLQNLEDIQDSADDMQLMRRSLTLSQQILDGRSSLSSGTSTPRPGIGATERDIESIQADIQLASDELQNLPPMKRSAAADKSAEVVSQGQGWSRYEGTWKPKPIGVV